MHIVQAHVQLHKQTDNGVCHHLYVELLFDLIAFLKKVDVVKIWSMNLYVGGMCLRQNDHLTRGKSPTCTYEVIYVCLQSYQVTISSDLAVGLTITDTVHVWHTVHRSLARNTSIIPQPSVHFIMTRITRVLLKNECPKIILERVYTIKTCCV